MTIPKNRDNSGTAILYIVGPNFLVRISSGQRLRLTRGGRCAADSTRNVGAADAVGCSRLLGGTSSATLPGMTIKALVHGGRLVVNEPTDLPEGTEVELLPLDPGDWLDDSDRAALHAALAESDADIAAGRVVDAAEVLKGLRAR